MARGFHFLAFFLGIALFSGCGNQSAGIAGSVGMVGTWIRNCSDMKNYVLTLKSDGTFSERKFLYPSATCEGAGTLLSDARGTFTVKDQLAEGQQDLDLKYEAPVRVFYTRILVTGSQMWIGTLDPSNLANDGFSPDKRSTFFETDHVYNRQ